MQGSIIRFVAYIYLFELISSSSNIFVQSKFQHAIDVLTKNPHGVRLFHPAFPDTVIKPLNALDISILYQKKDLLRITDEYKDYNAYSSRIQNEELLPWKVFPFIGLTETKKSFSSE